MKNDAKWPEESVAMSIAGTLRMNKLRWSLRRLYVPVRKNALVLEVGSGGNPYPRSNVLLDAYEQTRERHWEPLVQDRPTVLAFGENLPFKDKAFDFVIAAHVLEHTPEPEKFLMELQRVAHGGYIETPDAFMERINPYRDHRLEVTLRDDCLVIRKKHAWVVDAELVELYEHRAKRRVTQQLIPLNPSEFHVRYYWKDNINFRVVNPETDVLWKPVCTDGLSQNVGGMKQKWRLDSLKYLRWLFSQRRRNRNIDLLPLLRCPACRGGEFERQKGEIVCEGCGASYDVQQSVFLMKRSESERCL